MKLYSKTDIFQAFKQWHEDYLKNPEDHTDIDAIDSYEYAKKCSNYLTKIIKKNKENQMKGLMIQYVRGTRNIKTGVMIAFKEGDNVYVGYSLCMKSDKFDKEEGLEVARKRAYADFNNAKPVIAHSVAPVFAKFQERVVRYFKDGNKPAFLAA